VASSFLDFFSFLTPLAFSVFFCIFMLLSGSCGHLLGESLMRALLNLIHVERAHPPPAPSLNFFTLSLSPSTARRWTARLPSTTYQGPMAQLTFM
jgi:hypothetical protein